MSVENVERAILDTVQTTADFPWWLGQHKNAARCALVDPVLWALGWNTALPSQCRPDFPLAGGRKADYALFDRDGRLAAGLLSLLIGRSLSRRDSDRARLRDTVRGIKGGVAVLACVLHWELYDLSRRVRPFWWDIIAGQQHTDIQARASSYPHTKSAYRTSQPTHRRWKWISAMSNPRQWLGA